MSVTRGQCDARPTVTFPAPRHHCPLAGTKLYCLVTEVGVLTPCLGYTRQWGGWESNPRPIDHKSSTLPLYLQATLLTIGLPYFMRDDLYRDLGQGQGHMAENGKMCHCTVSIFCIWC